MQTYSQNSGQLLAPRRAIHDAMERATLQLWGSQPLACGLIVLGSNLSNRDFAGHVSNFK